LNSTYLDCNATSPLEPGVRELMFEWFSRTGNAGSRTHDYGAEAKRAVVNARKQVAAIVDAKPDEVVFVSGATEANNLAILGVARRADPSRRHVIATKLEHKAVLEPMDALKDLGFEVTLVDPTPGGWVDPDEIQAALRPDTLLVSVMHVNNETGVLQPLGEISELLQGHEAYFHVDAAQGFGKRLEDLRNPRLDLISVSSHKIYGPQGVGALIARIRGYDRVPLAPLAVGGGQEYGLRPGTLPVALIAAFGLAAELAGRDAERRAASCRSQKEQVLKALAPLGIRLHGDQDRVLPHVLNFSVEGLDGEAAIVALKDLIAISNGSACTSQVYSPSHVLQAMGLPEDAIEGALRLSWCHMTEEVDWEAVAKRIVQLR
jgi:cysteine desulfurase